MTTYVCSERTSLEERSRFGFRQSSMRANRGSDNLTRPRAYCERRRTSCGGEPRRALSALADMVNFDRLV